MRIAVLSDTHLRVPDNRLQQVWDEHLAQADAVVHCGDLTGERVLDFLEDHPALYAVSGNMCGWDIARRLDWKLEFELGGRRIGVTHGHGARQALPGGAVGLFGPGLDLVCYGHTHAFFWGEHQGTRLLNPGGFSHPRDGSPSIAVLNWPDGQEPDVRRILL